MSDGKELVTREQGFEVMPMDFLKQQTIQLEQLYKGLMQEGTDYGKVPGTDKPTLLKSGAELLRLRARLDPTFTIDSTGTNLATGVFSYTITCDLYRGGEHIGAGVGSCNSLESKYRYRWVFESALPKGIDKGELLTKKVKARGNWTPTYRIENDNPQDLANTILKMAKKRAFVDAILTVTGASRIFTQDVEDLADNGVIEDHKEVEPIEPSNNIDMAWLKESLEFLNWADAGKFLKEKYNVAGTSVSAMVKKLDQEQATDFVAEVQRRLEQ